MQLRPSLLLAPFFASLTAAASAEDLLYFNDFEDGFDGWSMDGLWDPVDDTSTCGSQAAPFPSRNVAAWFGLEDSCDFDEGFWKWTAGNFYMTEPVHIPADAEDVWLTAWSYEAAECDQCGWDWRFVYVSADGGASWDFIGEGTIRFQWYQLSFDLSAYKGEDVLVRFHFDAVDGAFNEYLGWLIDDVSIRANVCAEPELYCTAAPSSVSADGAAMSTRGNNSMSENDFKVECYDLPPNQFGVFFYGPKKGLAAVGDGFLCIGQGATGQFRVLPVAVADSSGYAFRKLDFSTGLPPLNDGPGQIRPGSTWFFQYWYRDPLGPGGTGFNFSNGAQITFCP